MKFGRLQRPYSQRALTGFVLTVINDLQSTVNFNNVSKTHYIAINQFDELGLPALAQHMQRIGNAPFADVSACDQASLCKAMPEGSKMGLPVQLRAVYKLSNAPETLHCDHVCDDPSVRGALPFVPRQLPEASDLHCRVLSSIALQNLRFSIHFESL